MGRSSEDAAHGPDRLIGRRISTMVLALLLAAAVGDALPLVECPGGSIGRLQKWLGHAHLVGSGGDASILVPDGDRYVARATFDGAGWSEVVVLLSNTAAAGIDLTESDGFTIRYSATADLWIELRGTVKLHGGDQYGVKLPSTGGRPSSRFIPLRASDWGVIPGLDPPKHAFADVLRTASLFDIVGRSANTVVFYGLRFDHYTPACRENPPPDGPRGQTGPLVDEACLPLDRGVGSAYGAPRRVPEPTLRLHDEIAAARTVVRRYGRDLADACLVRLSEIHSDCVLLTIDSEFRDVYRRHGRKSIPTRLPPKVRRRR